MNTCETCKYWRRYTVNEFGWESGQANPDDFGKCEAVEFKYWQATGTHPFYVMDGSDYRATLTTRRDFGCNQQKEAV